MSDKAALERQQVQAERHIQALTQRVKDAEERENAASAVLLRQQKE